MRILPYPRSDGKLFTMYVSGDEAVCLMTALVHYIATGPTAMTPSMEKLFTTFKEM